MSSGVLRPGDRPSFIEGWYDLNSPVEIDADYLTVQSLCRVIDLSQQAIEQLGISYRGFKVGCAILALDELGHRSGIYFGGNFTPYQGAQWNCAEKRALSKIEERGFNKVLAIAVSGPPQTDVSGVESPTLHPCHRCRAMFAQSELIQPETLVATSTPDGSAHELFTQESLERLHATHEPQSFPDTHRLLPFYWDQAINYDQSEERLEMARLDLIAKSIQ